MKVKEIYLCCERLYVMLSLGIDLRGLGVVRLLAL